MLVAHCNENDVQLAVGQDAQIDQAYDLGVVQAANTLSQESDLNGKHSKITSSSLS